MTARILPPAEWPKLAATDAAAIVPQFTATTRVVVVEHDGQIVGCHVLQVLLHAECLWVHPDHRGKASVARRLWRAVQREVRDHFGVPAFVTTAVSDDVRALLDHVGAVHVPGDQYLVHVGGV